jgi:hypothetical protein
LQIKHSQELNFQFSFDIFFVWNLGFIKILLFLKIQILIVVI